MEINIRPHSDRRIRDECEIVVDGRESGFAFTAISPHGYPRVCRFTERFTPEQREEIRARVSDLTGILHTKTVQPPPAPEEPMEFDASALDVAFDDDEESEEVEDDSE